MKVKRTSGFSTIRELSLNGRVILMRVDFNVPMQDGMIEDEGRIQAVLPSLRYLLSKGARVFLLSHLGRPAGKTIPEHSLKPCAAALSRQLQCGVLFLVHWLYTAHPRELFAQHGVSLILLENVRFHPEEENMKEKNSPFVQNMARFGDLYVNDAFGCCHRAHGSIVPLAQHFPQKCAAGFLLEKEVYYLDKLLYTPARPFYALIGGKKVSSKVGVLQKLADKVDGLLIGGAMAYTFLHLAGRKIGSSLLDEKSLPIAREILTLFERRNLPLILPTDALCADQFEENATTRIIDFKRGEGIPSGWMGMDLGPQTIESFIEYLKQARTILWNGPLGVSEWSAFRRGTEAMTEFLAESSATTIVGGGDSLAAVRRRGLEEKMTHLSTGGGATLEYLEKGTLPGIEALVTQK